jgi:hypothetical protein
MKKNFGIWLFIFIQSFHFCFSANTPNAEAENSEKNPNALRQQVIKLPIDGKGTCCNAVLYLPEDYAKSETHYSLLIYLHGRGGGKIDISKFNQGPSQYISPSFKAEAVNPKDGKLYKFIIISPHAQDTNWSYGVTQLKYMLPEIEKTYRIDTSRIYLTGVSAGGWGLWTCVADPEFVQKLAAVVPVSAVTLRPDEENQSKIIPNIKKYGLPVWMICGTDDAWYNNEFGAEYYFNLINKSEPPIPSQLTGILHRGHTVQKEAYNPQTDFTDPGFCTPPNKVKMNIYEWMLQFHK